MVFFTNSQTISLASSKEKVDMLEWPEDVFIQAESFELRGCDQVVSPVQSCKSKIAWPSRQKQPHCACANVVSQSETKKPNIK
jgi:hypothetical protein